MKFLIDILHPAHVHVFKYIHAELRGRGHKVIVTAREKEMSLRLLDASSISYTCISRQMRGIALVYEMFLRTWRLVRICQKEKPSLLLGIMGPSIAVAGRLLGIPVWIMYDTENATITNWFAYPLATRIYTPRCYQGRTRPNQKRYNGYHELAYLHPDRFTPDRKVLAAFGMPVDKPYAIMRFVGWQASHDIGEKGLSSNQKIKLYELLAAHCSVFISSESPLPNDLRPFQLSLPIDAIHHAIANAFLLVGESATMASEAAVLGVPAFFISDTGRGYTDEQEKRYDLVHTFTRCDFDLALEAIAYFLKHPPKPAELAAQRERLLADTVDLTSYMVNQITTFAEKLKCAE